VGGSVQRPAQPRNASSIYRSGCDAIAVTRASRRSRSCGRTELSFNRFIATIAVVALVVRLIALPVWI
jgi:hypothetical protein